MTRKYKSKEYKLSDGTLVTARGIAEAYNVPLRTTRTRLTKGVRDVEVLNKQPQPNKQHSPGGSKGTYVPEETVKERRSRRNGNCPMSKLFLTQKAGA